MTIGEKLALAGLEIEAIQLNPKEPFTWASGYRMPIYNDNRLFLANAEHRELIAYGFMNILTEEQARWYGIAGVATAGIPHATKLADMAGAAPLIYVRDKPKGHGLGNQIEGIRKEEGLRGKHYILIEDLISTGGSSARAVQAIRDAKGRCEYCLSIFDYGLDKAAEAFDALDPPCIKRSILDYDTLVRVAVEHGKIRPEDQELLAEWRRDPFGWGEKHGFPRVQ